MRALTLTVLALLSPAALAADAGSQVFASAAQAAPLYGRLGSARQAALGGAFSTVADGGEALFGNPAGLADADSLSVALHHEAWLADINEETGAVAGRLGPGLGLGGYAHVTDYGSFDVRDDSGQRVGGSSARDLACGLAAGLATGGLRGGVGLRLVKQELMGEDSLGLALDCGLLWRREGLSVGVAAVNVGTALDGNQGAESLRVGLGRRWDLDGMAVTPALGLEWEPQSMARAQAGLELGLEQGLRLRAGYEQRFADSMIDGVQGLTLGFGVQVLGLGLDYAFLPYGDLGAAHRFTLSWSARQGSKAP